MSHLFINCLSRMVFEHLQNYFHSKNFTSGFPHLFQLCSHILQGHIPCWITHILKTTCLLTMTKPSSGVCFIVMGETLYWLTSRILCLQFCDAFATHFSLH
jgi:hypothetical protein